MKAKAWSHAQCKAATDEDLALAVAQCREEAQEKGITLDQAAYRWAKVYRIGHEQRLRKEREARMSENENKATEPHQMERRLRLGSDGNGVFIAWSPDGGRTWRVHEHADRFAHDRDVRAKLPEAEIEVGRKHLACDLDSEASEYLARFYRGAAEFAEWRGPLDAAAHYCERNKLTAEIILGECVIGRMGTDGLAYWDPEARS